MMSIAIKCSAITPPVAIAAFAASTITKAEPLRTAFSAVKSGVVMFVIPFVFALYPELLLIEEAVIDPASASTGQLEYLPGYDGQLHWGPLIFLIIKVTIALYLISSALAAYGRSALSYLEIALRIVLAALLLTFSSISIHNFLKLFFGQNMVPNQIKINSLLRQ